MKPVRTRSGIARQEEADQQAGLGENDDVENDERGMEYCGLPRISINPLVSEEKKMLVEDIAKEVVVGRFDYAGRPLTKRLVLPDCP